MYAQEISAWRFVELCPGVVVSEKSPYFTHTHTHILLPQHLTNKTDQTLLSAVPVYRLVPSFPVYFHEDESSLHDIFLVRQIKHD
jgi:hypothetical protein